MDQPTSEGDQQDHGGPSRTGGQPHKLIPMRPRRKLCSMRWPHTINVPGGHGAPLIPAFAIRLPDDTFQVVIEPALDLQRTEDRESDVEAGMKMVVAAMERRIAQHPEQWLVAQRIWPE